MKTYTQLRNLYGKITLDVSSDNLTLGDELINDEFRTIYAEKDWGFLHRARTMVTVADTQFGALPYDMELVESVYVTVSSQRHPVTLMHSRDEWDRLNFSVSTSDTPEYAFVYNGELGLWPTPATSANVITVNGKVRLRDLNTADDTARTIAGLANGSTALSVSAGLTAQMVGFWIRPTFSTTANTGDGGWYEIASITNSTTAALVRKYGGVSISAGSAACTIGQIPYGPEFMHDMPVWLSGANYWYQNGNSVKGDNFMKTYDRKRKALNNYTSEISSPVIWNGEDEDMINPNLVVSL